jgi:hypothetical protein
MFIVIDIMDYMKYVLLFVDIYHIMIYNKFNKRNIKQKVNHFYVLINDSGTHNIYKVGT